MSVEGFRFGVKDLLFVNENAEPGCGLKRLMVDCVAKGLLEGSVRWDKESWEELGEMMVEVNLAVVRLVGMGLLMRVEMLEFKQYQD
jgi:hypothetical protein